MDTATLWEEIAAKGSDKAAIAARLAAERADLLPLLEGLKHPKGNVKFGCEKVLRALSEQAPQLLSVHFPRLASLLDQDNRILKWGGILILARLAREDVPFQEIFDRFFGLIRGNDMIAAANVIRSAAWIAEAHPEWTSRIVNCVLQVEAANYKTPECRHVAIGHALDALGALCGAAPASAAIREFAERQASNPRASTARRAQRLRLRLENAANRRPSRRRG